MNDNYAHYYYPEFHNAFKAGLCLNNKIIMYFSFAQYIKCNIIVYSCYWFTDNC